MPPRARAAALLAAVALLPAACSGMRQDAAATATTASAPAAEPTPTPTPTDPSPSARPESTPSAPADPDLAAVDVRLVEVATLEQPTALAVRRGDDALYLAERTGRVRVLRDGELVGQPLLDLSDETTTDGERGLLGIAFSPDGGRLYASYTNLNGDSRLASYELRRDGRLQPGSRRELLRVEQPYSNHNGGHIAFGPDGMLYLGLGDGGGAGDPLDNAQSLDTLLGALLRLQPDGDVPDDNPFVGREGAEGAIFAYGLRNPWRFSFDRETGDLWIADVGQSAVEEIDFAEPGRRGLAGAGANYGWNRLEGDQPFAGDPPPDAVPPLYTYARDGGRCSVIGGYVYRGDALPALRGAYLYGDLCDRRVRALVQRDGEVVDRRDLGLQIEGSLISFGQDADGELYVMSQDGPVYRIAPAS